MFWFCGILAGLLVSAADIFLLTRERKASVCIHAVLRDSTRRRQQQLLVPLRNSPLLIAIREDVIPREFT